MQDGSDRKAFQFLPGEENPQFLEDGHRIYLEMRTKYPGNTNKDLDNILNGICAALTCLLYVHVAEDDRRYMIQAIHKILTQNA